MRLQTAHKPLLAFSLFVASVGCAPEVIVIVREDDDPADQDETSDAADPPGEHVMITRIRAFNQDKDDPAPMITSFLTEADGSSHQTWFSNAGCAATDGVDCPPVPEVTCAFDTSTQAIRLEGRLIATSAAPPPPCEDETLVVGFSLEASGYTGPGTFPVWQLCYVEVGEHFTTPLHVPEVGTITVSVLEKGIFFTVQSSEICEEDPASGNCLPNATGTLAAVGICQAE